MALPDPFSVYTRLNRGQRFKLTYSFRIRNTISAGKLVYLFFMFVSYVGQSVGKNAD